MSIGGDYESKRAWMALCKGLTLGHQGGVQQFLDLAKEHYWDSLESQKDLILLHLNAIAKIENCTYEQKSHP